MRWLLYFLVLLSYLTQLSCSNRDEGVPVVGFVDALEDNTLKKATNGFMAALSDAGFSEGKNTVKIIYRNAQGNMPALTQIVNYMVSEQVDLIASNPTVSTIAAVQNTRTIPVFMMVSSTPRLMKVTDKQGKEPDNLYGVAENLNYIDTSFSLIKQLLHKEKEGLRVGMIYNQSEPQSVEALQRIKSVAESLKMELVALPLNSSADALLVTQSLLTHNIDAFFANPDNTVFAAFETIINACNKQSVPVFTSEAGLVERGAVAAFGADMYQWGYQAGQQAAAFLKDKNPASLRWELVKQRRFVYNAEAAAKYKIVVPSHFQKL